MAARITKKAVEEAAKKYQQARAQYHPNDLCVVRREIAYQEIKEAYAAQQLRKNHANLNPD